MDPEECNKTVDWKSKYEALEHRHQELKQRLARLEQKVAELKRENVSLGEELEEILGKNTMEW